ncbi:MAG: hypothetical protein ACP5N2_00260 [Candidatus Nanoarchaeia archaeon]
MKNSTRWYVAAGVCLALDALVITNAVKQHNMSPESPVVYMQEEIDYINRLDKNVINIQIPLGDSSNYISKDSATKMLEEKVLDAYKAINHIPSQFTEKQKKDLEYKQQVEIELTMYREKFTERVMLATLLGITAMLLISMGSRYRKPNSESVARQKLDNAENYNSSSQN